MRQRSLIQFLTMDSFSEALKNENHSMLYVYLIFCMTAGDVGSASPFTKFRSSSERIPTQVYHISFLLDYCRELVDINVQLCRDFSRVSLCSLPSWAHAMLWKPHPVLVRSSFPSLDFSRTKTSATSRGCHTTQSNSRSVTL